MNEQGENRIQHYDRDHVFHPVSNLREMADAQALILDRGKRDLRSMIYMAENTWMGWRAFGM